MSNLEILPSSFIKFYTFVADNYAPFLSKPIECNEGEGAHVLDGKLYNESEFIPRRTLY